MHLNEIRWQFACHLLWGRLAPPSWLVPQYEFASGLFYGGDPAEKFVSSARDADDMATILREKWISLGWWISKVLGAELFEIARWTREQVTHLLNAGHLAMEGGKLLLMPYVRNRQMGCGRCQWDRPPEERSLCSACGVAARKLRKDGSNRELLAQIRSHSCVQPYGALCSYCELVKKWNETLMIRVCHEIMGVARSVAPRKAEQPFPDPNNFDVRDNPLHHMPISFFLDRR